MASDSHRSQRDRADDQGSLCVRCVRWRGRFEPSRSGQVFVRWWRVPFQFITITDPMEIVRAAMIGWSDNGGSGAFQARPPFDSALPAAQFNPIELGVVSAMLILPLSVWRSLFEYRVRPPLDLVDSDDSDWWCCSHQHL